MSDDDLYSVVAPVDGTEPEELSFIENGKQYQYAGLDHVTERTAVPNILHYREQQVIVE